MDPKNLNTTRSFALRKRRLTSVQKKAINELWLDYGLCLNKKKIDLADIFGKGREIISDLGFGKGEALLHLAENNKEISFLGIDVYLSGIGTVLHQASKKNINNLKIINNDVFFVFKRFLENQSLNHVLLFYPDPWPKKKHQKRRLVNREFINLLEKKIKKGGIFYCKTDLEDYAVHIKRNLENNLRWARIAPKKIPQFFLSIPITRYEKKALAAGRELNNIIYKKL